MSANRSGFYVPGDAKALAKLMLGDRRSLFLVTQNGDSLKTFAPVAPSARPSVRLRPLDSYALFTLASGRTRRQELSYGSTYLSQSSRYLAIPPGARRAVVYDSRGESRGIEF
jgi:hypothetical protein